jgi:predicted transcriptional regulator
MKDIDLHVGYDPIASKARVLDAIRRAEAGVGAATAGGDVAPESHVTFESWDGVSRALSGKRLELLRHVRQKPAPTVAELARELGRDYKRVHQDVEILTAAGLLNRTQSGGVSAAYDEIRTLISLVSS